MNLICEFSISGLDNMVEDITMYDDENYSTQKMVNYLEKLIEDKKLTIGEKCEGSIEVDDEGFVVIEYKYCDEVGEDWNDDVWIEDQLYRESDLILRLTE